MFKRTLMTAVALSGAAFAQETPAPDSPAPDQTVTAAAEAAGRVNYDAAFFAQFSPRTALDMVRQTPGFSLDNGDDRRGFSGAVGNVLIDGLRPGVKSQSVSSILSRIPSNQVVRIELLRGAEVAGDASGQSVLLNVVRTPSGGSGVWEGGMEVTSRHIVAPRADVSYSGRFGQTEYSVGANYFSTYRDLPGGRRFYDADGTQTGSMLTPSPRNFREGSLTATLATPVLGGRLSANAQIDGFRFHADNRFHSFDAAGDPTESLIDDYTEGDRGYELGLNYDRDIGEWTLAMVALANRTRFESEEDAVTIEPVSGDELGALSQDITQESGESILRGTVSRGFGNQRIEIGAEGAFNSLDAELDLVEDGVPLSIPNANVLVEETRGEAFVVHTLRPAERWSVETRLAGETSTLEFEGDANQSVELSYFKPSFQVSHDFGERNQVRVRLYRDIGQLDFGDFVSATAVADELIDGGNPNLRPETSWRAELGADLRFPGGAALGVTLTRHWIRDAADVVEVRVDPDGVDDGDPSDDIRFDAPGNIGDGEGTELEINLTAPLAPFIPGGRLTIEGELWQGEVTDPVTGQTRGFSFRPESELEISFRQDIASWKFAWGLEIYKEGEFQAYRFNEIDTQEEGPWVDLFVETTALPHNMKLTAFAANLFDGEVRRQRNFFTPDRSGAPDRYEERDRIFASAPWLVLELSGTF